ncbi:MAG: amidase [Clostridiales bacterium]|nr:amidase [Clostridiales bacterium]
MTIIINFEYNVVMNKYDRISAINYAQKYALSPNPNFYHFGGIGGDCTNFISQCLLAGGCNMQYSSNGWYYNSSYDRSPSWTSVSELHNFLLNNKKSGPHGEIISLNSLEIGDIIQLKQNTSRFNHTVIITKIQNGEIYVCAHSNDALHRKLSTYNFIELIPIHIIKIP